MTVRSHRPRFLYGLLALPLLLGAKDGGGCCNKPVVEETDVVVVPPPKVDDPKITSIEPSTGKPNESFSAYIYGASFKDGAKVSLTDRSLDKALVKDANTIQIVVPALAAGTYDVVVENPDGRTARLRQGLLIKAPAISCKFVRVGFDFDQSSLTADGKSALDANMACFQSATGKISIEGHADERGTTEYNLALGDRRAESVKRYITNGGVSAGRVSTVSFGEEKPLATGNDESAWAQNRRADIYVAE